MKNLLRAKLLSATCILAAWLGCLCGSESCLAQAETPPPAAKVLFFTRNVGYEHSVVHRQGAELSHAERVLTEMGRRAGITVVCTKDGRVFDDDLTSYGAFAFYTNNDLTQPDERKDPPMTAAGKERLLRAIHEGKGFVGFHSTCASWRTPGPQNTNRPEALDPFLAMLGGEFIAHGAQQKATLRNVSPEFPGTKTLGNAFALHEEWYGLKHFASDLHVILVQETDHMTGQWYQRPPYPATWARRHGKGRVFYTSLGHREDVWTNEQFQTLVLGGLAWALGQADAELVPNLQTVTPQASELSREGKPGG